MSTAEGKLKHRNFSKALEEERRKIQMFPKELPLSLQLVTEAIENLRRMAREEDSSEGPLIEEFFPLRPGSSSSGSEESQRTDKGASDCKPDWLKSVQIWDPVVLKEPLPSGESTLRKPVAVYAKVGGAFQPFEKDKLAQATSVPSAEAAVSSGTDTTIGGRRDDAGEDVKEEGQWPAHSQPNRKQRRSWSPDLHRKFLNVLEQLGGSHVATPKQIRELMKVDGLTNDEVKSHLQKYRLHTRRPATTVQSSSSSSPQTPPQFVVMGGIWVHTPGYATVATSAAAAAVAQLPEGSGAPLNSICSPVASLPLESGLQEEQHNKQQHSNMTPTMPLHLHQKCSQGDDSLADDAATESNSSSTSFSSQTITASPSL